VRPDAFGQELLDVCNAPGADTSLNILRDVGPAHRVCWLIPHLRSAGEPPLHIEYTAGLRRVTAATGHHRFDQITAPLKGRNLSRCARYCGGEGHKSHNAAVKHDLCATPKHDVVDPFNCHGAGNMQSCYHHAMSSETCCSTRVRISWRSSVH